jgi:hypothetical protein
MGFRTQYTKKRTKVYSIASVLHMGNNLITTHSELVAVMGHKAFFIIYLVLSLYGLLDILRPFLKGWKRNLSNCLRK